MASDMLILNALGKGQSTLNFVKATHVYAEGRFRDAAEHYRKAFELAPRGWKGCLNVLSGYTSIFREDRLVATDNDIAFLTSVCRNERLNPSLRVLCYMCRGYVNWRAGDRAKAAADYRKGLEIGLAATPAQREVLQLLPLRATGNYGLVPSGPFMDTIMHSFAHNLETLQGGPSELSQRAQKQASYSPAHGVASMRMPSAKELKPELMVGGDPALRPLAENQEKMMALLDEVTRVGGTNCDNCGQAASAQVKLSRCSRCYLMYYCSSACQKAAWKGGHKKRCRKRGKELEPGDWVKVHGLKSAAGQQTNNKLMIVRGPAEQAGRYNVSILGHVPNTAGLLSIPMDNLQLMRYPAARHPGEPLWEQEWASRAAAAAAAAAATTAPQDTKTKEDATETDQKQ